MVMQKKPEKSQNDQNLT